MTEHLQAPKFGPYVYKRVIGIVAIGLVPLTLSIVLPIGSIATWIVVLSFIGSGLTASIFAIRLMRRFRCPRCGASIPNHESVVNGENSPVFYRCKPCDVVWDSGLRTPSNL